MELLELLTHSSNLGRISRMELGLTYLYNKIHLDIEYNQSHHQPLNLDCKYQVDI
jgi:hypothetical protein